MSRQSDNQTMRQGNNNKSLGSGPSPKKSKVVRHTDLEVYNRSFSAAMQVFHLSKKFPREERYALTDQVRRSSRSVAANIAEGWRKRRYSASFINKLNESEGEAAETQSWLQFAVECEYLRPAEVRQLYKEFDEIIAMLVTMQNHPDQWCLTKR
jgi:four helix bundle protein